MRQQVNQYLRRRKSDNHPGNDGLTTRFSSFLFNRINVEQFLFIRYFQKDLIFISGLFFVLNFPFKAFRIENTNSNPNQIMWDASHTKQLSK
jgi:hypothetical protein